MTFLLIKKKQTQKCSCVACMPSVISRAKISAFLQSIVMLPFSRFITRTISHAISLLKLDQKRRNALDVLPGFPKPSGKNYQMPSPRCMQLVAVTQPVHFFELESKSSTKLSRTLIGSKRYWHKWETLSISIWISFQYFKR